MRKSFKTKVFSEYKTSRRLTTWLLLLSQNSHIYLDIYILKVLTGKTPIKSQQVQQPLLIAEVIIKVSLKWLVLQLEISKRLFRLTWWAVSWIGGSNLFILYLSFIAKSKNALHIVSPYDIIVGIFASDRASWYINSGLMIEKALFCRQEKKGFSNQQFFVFLCRLIRNLNFIRTTNLYYVRNVML